MLEQKLAAAKTKRHKRAIILIVGFIIIIILGGVVIFFISCCQNNPEETKIIFSGLDKKTEGIVVADNPAQSQIPPQVVPDAQLRQSYINALNDYRNNVEPELNKIDLNQWDKPRSDRLVILQEEALSKFSISDYAGALSDIEELTQLAQVMVTDSQQQFDDAFSDAQAAYDTDNYDDAKFYIATALMLNNQSQEAATLLSNIDKLPDILPLLEKANTARVENNHKKELSLIKELVKLVPERKSAVERKRVLTGIINKKNFKSIIAQSYQAIEQGNAAKAKQRLMAAENIFPERQEIANIKTALQELDKKQRLEKYQQAAQMAIASDDWVTAKQQLELALQEQIDDKLIQKSLARATTIITLKNEFDQYIDNPYRLSNKQLASKVKDKKSEASAYVDISPSLNKKTDQLSRLLESMNKKIPVEVISDSQTNIIVRGVGVVGVTQSKVIQLTPGRYKFEGKREGFKSKLIDVLIPYDKKTYRLKVVCDEPI
jgi:hypothetical protein